MKEYLHTAEVLLAWRRSMLAQGANFGLGLGVGGLGADPTWSEIVQYYKTQSISFGHPLMNGDLFYGGLDFCDVLQREVDALTDDVALQASWFPASVGFLYFQREMELPGLRTPPPDMVRSLAFRALGWSCLKIGRRVDARHSALAVPEDPADAEFVNLATMIEHRNRESFVPMSFLNWKVGRSLNDRIAQDDSEGDPQDRYRDLQRHELRYAAVLLLLLQHRFLVRTLPLEWDQAARRRHERENLRAPENIRVISFRDPGATAGASVTAASVGTPGMGLDNPVNP